MLGHNLHRMCDNLATVWYLCYLCSLKCICEQLSFVSPFVHAYCLQQPFSRIAGIYYTTQSRASSVVDAPCQALIDAQPPFGNPTKG